MNCRRDGEHQDMNRQSHACENRSGGEGGPVLEESSQVQHTLHRESHHGLRDAAEGGRSDCVGVGWTQIRRSQRDGECRDSNNQSRAWAARGRNSGPGDVSDDRNFGDIDHGNGTDGETKFVSEAVNKGRANKEDVVVDIVNGRSGSNAGQRVLMQNVRGLRGDGKVRMIKDLKKKYRLNMLGLIETKRPVVTKFDVASFWGCDSVGWPYVEADGASGGLLLTWDETNFKMNNCYKGERWLCVEGIMLKNNFNCIFFLVYGAHTREEKLVIWEALSYTTGLCQVPYCFIGDFNEILNIEERKCTTSLTASTEDFKDWIQDMQLLDLPLNDRKFTWFRGRSCSRLDRVLVSLKWAEEFPEIRLRGGPKGLSDHCPLIVEGSRLGDGPRPFRSLDSWFTHEGFLRMVKEEWMGLGEIQFTDKLKALTISLGRWHKDNFRDMDNKIMKSEEEIKKIDDMMSRSRLAKDMDKNTRYFHNIASTTRRNNKVDALEESPMVGFRDGLVGMIAEEDAAALEVLPSIEEIRNAVWDCDSSRAPRSDGYNMNFIKKCWDEIGAELTATVGFFQTFRLPTDTNITWVALAPKFVGAMEIKDLQRISMVGCVYKVISKVLVRRMRSVIPALVGNTQSAFVKGRKIHDGALIACETDMYIGLKEKFISPM
nr:uncharacterized protein LOC114924353 [Arachis hypogaea]